MTSYPGGAVPFEKPDSRKGWQHTSWNGDGCLTPRRSIQLHGCTWWNQTDSRLKLWRCIDLAWTSPVFKYFLRRRLHPWIMPQIHLQEVLGSIDIHRVECHTRSFEYSFDQWPFQEPKLEVPTIYKVYVRAKFQRIYQCPSVPRCPKMSPLWHISEFTLSPPGAFRILREVAV